MKWLIIPIFFLITGPVTCSKQDQLSDNQKPGVCFKGRLSVTGICGNFVIEVIEGDIDRKLVVEKWTHPYTGVVYNNAFALESICTFPTTIQEGDEFYFSIAADSPEQKCPVCLAYSPVPEKRISIDICNTSK